MVMSPRSTWRITTTARAMSNGAPAIKQWQSEFVTSSGVPIDLPDHTKNLASQALAVQRNPKMPLIWSQPGKLYTPP